MVNEYLAFAKDIAFYAGKIMLKFFREENESEYKEDQTIVTKADKEINSYLIKRVKEKYPTHCVDGEEEVFGKSNYVWVCDPVDGTAMYARHIPVAVFSLALVIDGSPEVAVVYDPFTNSLYESIKGSGAYKNGEKIQVSDINLNDKRSVSNYDMWNASEYDIYPVVKKLSEKTYLVSIGSVIRASLCVATGDFNLALFPGTKHKNCDMAAVKLIVEEAGGKVTNLFGEEQRYDKDINGTIVSNGIVHETVVTLVKENVENKY